MITDVKLQRMFEQCRSHKRQIDRKLAALRVGMLFPPLLIAVFIFINYIMLLISGAVIAIIDGAQHGAGGLASFLAALIISLFVSGETLIENKQLIESSNWFYVSACGGCVLLTFLTFERTCAVLGFYCIIELILNFFFKRIYAENEMLKTLKGYPHFNIMLMSPEDFVPEDPEGKKVDPKDMSEDERIMYEREGGR